MAITGSQYIIDFTAEATAAPWSNASWTNIVSTFQNTNGSGLRPSTTGVAANNKYNTVATETLIKAKCTFSTGASVFSDTATLCIMDNTSHAGYLFHCNGSQGRLYKRTTGTGLGTQFAAAFAISLSDNTSEVELWYDTTSGDISAVVDDVVISTANDTDYQSSDLVVGLYLDPQNSNARRVGKFAADLLASAVIIDSSPADIRVTNARTFRVTTSTTALNTGNVSIKVSNSSKPAITPTSVTLVSGTTYDVVVTVPDAYPLKYSNTGYGVIITTPDGEATSGNIPYLPVSTDNAFVNITANGNGDLDISGGTLSINDQLENTNASVVTISGDARVTTTNSSASFSVRAWSEADQIWQSWGLQTQTLSGTLQRLKYWNGSTWVAKTLKYWNGSAWVEKTIKYWNGSSWV